MASYKIEWKNSAQKELRKLPKKIIPRIIQAVETLADEQHPTNSRKLVGSNSTYRVRVGDYRIIYKIESYILVIQIIKIGHRREIYKK